MNNFVVTIARSYGSGGSRIGQALAKELGVSYYDRKLLRLASDESGIDEALFGRADEKLKGTLLFKLARKVYNGEIIGPESDDFVSNENLFHYQAKVIRELAEQESCVIIGRCADFVLREYPNALRIYIHAPLENRICRLAQSSALSEHELRRFIMRIDKYRAGYHRYFTGLDWKEADNYDLCLNSGDLEIDRCVSIIQSYMKIRLE